MQVSWCLGCWAGSAAAPASQGGAFPFAKGGSFTLATLEVDAAVDMDVVEPIVNAAAGLERCLGSGKTRSRFAKGGRFNLTTMDVGAAVGALEVDGQMTSSLQQPPDLKAVLAVARLLHGPEIDFDIDLVFQKDPN